MKEVAKMALSAPEAELLQAVKIPEPTNPTAKPALELFERNFLLDIA